MGRKFLKVGEVGARARGLVNTPASTAADMRALLKSEGISGAMDVCGLCRVAVLAVAAETTVQAQTLAAAIDGIRRAQQVRA